jgi:hypothetical protein
VVGEHSIGQKSQPITVDGGIGRDPAGISSDNRGENPRRRKSKVSWGRLIRPGSVGP